MMGTGPENAYFEKIIRISEKISVVCRAARIVGDDKLPKEIRSHVRALEAAMIEHMVYNR
jgi:hypothetical protein